MDNEIKKEKNEETKEEVKNDTTFNPVMKEKTTEKSKMPKVLAIIFIVLLLLAGIVFGLYKAGVINLDKVSGKNKSAYSTVMLAAEKTVKNISNDDYGMELEISANVDKAFTDNVDKEMGSASENFKLGAGIEKALKSIGIKISGKDKKFGMQVKILNDNILNLSAFKKSDSEVFVNVDKLFKKPIKITSEKLNDKKTTIDFENFFKVIDENFKEIDKKIDLSKEIEKIIIVNKTNTKNVYEITYSSDKYEEVMTNITNKMKAHPEIAKNINNILKEFAKLENIADGKTGTMDDGEVTEEDIKNMTKEDMLKWLSEEELKEAKEFFNKLKTTVTIKNGKIDELSNKLVIPEEMTSQYGVKDITLKLRMTSADKSIFKDFNENDAVLFNLDSNDVEEVSEEILKNNIDVIAYLNHIKELSAMKETGLDFLINILSMTLAMPEE